jgi:hypothetical protein
MNVCNDREVQIWASLRLLILRRGYLMILNSSQITDIKRASQEASDASKILYAAMLVSMDDVSEASNNNLQDAWMEYCDTSLVLQLLICSIFEDEEADEEIAIVAMARGLSSAHI